MPSAFTQKEIKLITSVIREWPLTEKLTWDLICESSQLILGFKPTRQALSGKQLIANSYKVRKIEIASNNKLKESLPLPKSLAAAATQIYNLQEENRKLREELATMAEAAETFIHNATLHMSHAQLTKKPPKINRR